jgi:hypothetical protein
MFQTIFLGYLDFVGVGVGLLVAFCCFETWNIWNNALLAEMMLYSLVS